MGCLFETPLCLQCNITRDLCRLLQLFAQMPCVCVRGCNGWFAELGVCGSGGKKNVCGGGEGVELRRDGHVVGAARGERAGRGWGDRREPPTSSAGIPMTGVIPYDEWLMGLSALGSRRRSHLDTGDTLPFIWRSVPCCCCRRRACRRQRGRRSTGSYR